MEKEYIINDKVYRTAHTFDGELYEYALVDFETEHKYLVRYGETLNEAQSDLEDAIKEDGLKDDENNIRIKWEDLPKKLRHKIYVYGRKVNSELMSEWHGIGEVEEIWCERMTYYCSEVYPHRFTISDYNTWNTFKV